MDIEAFRSAFELGSQALSVLRGAKDLLPSGPEREAAERKLIEAERAFSIAEARAAIELGYQICRCTWPPQIMNFYAESGEWRRPQCRGSSLEAEFDAKAVVSQANESNGLDGTALAILKTIAEAENVDVDAPYICCMLDMSEVRAEYYLTELTESDMIEANTAAYQPTVYSLKQKGRAFLVGRGIV